MQAWEASTLLAEVSHMALYISDRDSVCFTPIIEAECKVHDYLSPQMRFSPPYQRSDCKLIIVDYKWHNVITV